MTTFGVHDDRMHSDTRDPVIEASGLRKSYSGTPALDGLDLVAPSGAVTAILGPNGAGKTTFVKAVATLLRPDSGDLVVAGIDAVRHPERVRTVIGLAGQYAAVEPALTGRENLVMVARLFGHTRRAAGGAADEVLERMGLSDAAGRLVRTYSGGMRRRLDLGASLVGVPQLLLLDEPTTGLDPRSRIDLWNAIRELVTGGTDVLMTTQYLEEADQLADHVVIVDRGRTIATGTPASLKREAGLDMIEVRVRDDADLAGACDILARLGDETPRVDGPTRRVSVPVADGAEQLSETVRAFADRRIGIDDIGLRRPTLDEVFLTLTGHSADEPTHDDLTDHAA